MANRVGVGNFKDGQRGVDREGVQRGALPCTLPVVCMGHVGGDTDAILSQPKCIYGVPNWTIFMHVA